MGSEGHTFRVLFFPLMAQGHMLPMIDIAKLFVARGMAATVLTTPANATLIQPMIDRCRELGHLSIQLLLVPFPSDSGLPQGCENLSSVPMAALISSFFEAMSKFEQPFDRILGEVSPDCIVTDTFLPWTYNVAAKHGIPRLVFHGMNYFYFCASDSIERHRLLDDLEDGGAATAFTIPGLPHKIDMLRSQLPDREQTDPVFLKILKQLKDAEHKSYGVVVNSFYELEPSYVEHYKHVTGRKAWHVGPVSLCNKHIVDMSARGSQASADQDACLKWLESKGPRSVMFVCFGSMAEFSVAQLRAIALGLEAANRPFIWAVRQCSEEWMPEGFEERVGGRGLIIRGWAPHILILGHGSIGGFVTHCGWNSSLEGITAGLPLVTWPLFAEQFYSERLIVDVLKIGVPVGAKVYDWNAVEREMVEATAIERAVNELMGEGDEAVERRRRVRELTEMGIKAMENDGSSHNDMNSLIRELTDMRITRASSASL